MSAPAAAPLHNRYWAQVLVWQWLLLIGLSLTLTLSSRFLTLPGLPFAVLWPASGLFLGVTLALGRRTFWVLLPTLALGTAFFVETSWLIAVTTAGGLGLGIIVSVVLIERAKKRIEARGTLSPLHYLPNLYIHGAVIGSGLSSFIATIGYYLTIPGAAAFPWQDIWLVYWLLEALGVVLFAPIVFFLFRRPLFTTQSLAADFRKRPMVIWLFMVISVIIASVVLSAAGEQRYAPMFAFALFPLVCWFAAEAKPASLDTVIPLFAIVYLGLALNYQGGLPPINDLNVLLTILLQIGILTVMAQLVASINHQRHLLLDRFRRQAYQDFRTGLANDRGLYLAIEEALAANRQAHHFLVYINLLDIHIIKELLAIDGAITVESVLTQQLQHFALDNSVIARLSGGRFAMLLSHVPRQQAELMVNELHERLSRPVDEAGIRTNLRIAVGVTPVDGRLFSPQQYVSVAVQAANYAKQHSLKVHWVTDPKQVAAQHYTKLNRFGLLKEAIEKSELELYGQQIKSLQDSNEKLSFEVLIRLRDEQGALLAPADFMPAAEAFGLMPALDRWAIRQTLQLLASQRQQLITIHKCAINLSGASLSDPDLAHYIEAQLGEFNIPATLITFEITETETIANKALASQFMQAVRQLGCRIALDDFGTGLASFEYLRQFHFDELKIDGVFIREIAENPVDRSIVEAICHVARTMQLKTIAEFVETTHHSLLLAGLGVDYAQGYGIGKPKPLSDLLNYGEQTPAALHPDH